MSSVQKNGSLKNSIATTLLRVVFSWYLVVAVSVTLIHMIVEYYQAKDNIYREIISYEDIFGPQLAGLLWDLDKQQIQRIIKGMLAVPIIEGIIIEGVGKSNKISIGKILDNQGHVVKITPEGNHLSEEKKTSFSNLFVYQFPIKYHYQEKPIKVGIAKIFSSRTIVFQRVKLGFIFLIINAVIKTVVIWLIFLWVSRTLLSRPLAVLTSATQQLNIDNLEDTTIDVQTSGRNELKLLEEAFNSMARRLQKESSEKRKFADDLIKSNAELQEHRRSLEKTVNLRTIELQTELAKRKRTEEELYKINKELIHARDQAIKANQHKSEFLANISHELRTPLHAILSFSEFGINRFYKIKSEKLITYFQMINEGGKTLLLLINDLLDLTKLESGKSNFEFRDTDFSNLVKLVIDEFNFLASKQNLSINFTDSNSSLFVRVDENKIKQVIRNLLSNAVKFSPENGRIELILAEENGSVKLSVSDQGVGIPDNEFESIFEEFIQSSITKNGAGGTGLGLPICRKIISRHKGRIWAKNNPKGGANFFFVIPNQS